MTSRPFNPWVLLYDSMAFVMLFAGAGCSTFGLPDWAAVNWAGAAYMKVCALREELKG